MEKKNTKTKKLHEIEKKLHEKLYEIEKWWQKLNDDHDGHGRLKDVNMAGKQIIDFKHIVRKNLIN